MRTPNLAPTLDSASIVSEAVDHRSRLHESDAERRETQQGTNAEELWMVALSILKDNVSTQVYQTWFQPIQALHCDGDLLELQVPSQFFYEWLEEHYSDLLRSVIGRVFGQSVRMHYRIVVRQAQESLEERTIRLPAFRSQNPRQQQISFNNSTSDVPSIPTNLNNRYTFDNFIRGESNQLAVSAAIAIADNPGKTRYNPLFVYGDTGLGKTHLVHAIGNAARSKNPALKVLYTNSEKFTNEYINAIQNNKISEFTNFYRSVDILIVDDIQFLAGKERTQDNFFHTFNSLHQSGKQLILTSDKPPRDLQDLDARLISRFQWGLTVDIQPPDFETRLAIIRRKSQDEGFDIPGTVAELIAKHVQSSVRELEGCLISFMAKVTFDKREPSVEVAKEVIRSVADKRIGAALSATDLKQRVCEHYHLTPSQLESKSRKHEIVVARQMAMYLIKNYIGISLKSIGALFGGRDHTTVLHAIATIENYRDTDEQVRGDLALILKSLELQ